MYPLQGAPEDTLKHQRQLKTKRNLFTISPPESGQRRREREVPSAGTSSHGRYATGAGSAPEPSRVFDRQPLNKPRQKSGEEAISGTGRVDHITRWGHRAYFYPIAFAR